MSTYKYGSSSLTHENAYLKVPTIRWLGVKSSDLQFQQEGKDDIGLLDLTARDRRKATKMLGKEVFAEEGAELEWRRELQVMLMLDMKAETQLLSSREGGLEQWLGKKMTDERRAWKSESE